MGCDPKEKAGRLLPRLVAVCLLLTGYAGLFRAGAAGGELPQPGEAFFYSDEAGVLDEAVRAAILEKNQELAPSGAQIVVMTADSLPVDGYTQRVAYLQKVMDAWQVGGEQSLGLILALSVSDGDYIAVAGEGLHGCFPTEELKALLDAYLEPDFSAQAYSAGVGKFLDQAAAQAMEYAGAGPAAEPAESGAKPTALWVVLIAGGVALAGAATALLIRRTGRRRSSRRGVHRRPRLVTPSHTTVLRREPSVVVRPSRSAGAYRRDGSRTRRR